MLHGSCGHVGEGVVKRTRVGTWDVWPGWGFDNSKMMESSQTESRLRRKEVGNLKKGMTILTNNFQSAEVLLNMKQTGTKLLKKEVIHLQENTNPSSTDNKRLNE